MIGRVIRGLVNAMCGIPAGLKQRLAEREAERHAAARREQQWLQEAADFADKLRRLVAAGEFNINCGQCGPINHPRYGNVGEKCDFCPRRLAIGETYGIVSYVLDTRYYHPGCLNLRSDSEFTAYEHRLRGGGWSAGCVLDPPVDCNICKESVVYGGVVCRYTFLQKQCCQTCAGDPAAWRRV